MRVRVVTVVVVVVLVVVEFVVVTTVLVTVMVSVSVGWAWAMWGNKRLDSSRARRRNRHALISIALCCIGHAPITLVFNGNRTLSVGV